MSTAHSLAPRSWAARLVFLPIRLAWALATWVVGLIGILLGLLTGFILMALGVLLCSAIVTAFIGIPMFLVGMLLVLRALY
jgi:hypothetical protein